MDRREFIQKLIILGLSSSSLALWLTGCRPIGEMLNGAGSGGPGAGGAGVTGNTGSAPGSQANAAGYPDVDLVIAAGTDPDSLMAKGLQAFGGIRRFVKSGGLVVIKPNFSVPTKPEDACTTNPFLVAALVKQCLDGGAKEVRVIDHPFTSGAMCLENSGIRKYCEAAGARVYVLNTLNSSYYTQVDMQGQLLKTAYFSKDVLDADLFINFPILKNHATTSLTMGMKNMMGLVWDRGFFHSTDIYRTIAELTAFKKPHLIIMDALKGITANGPEGPGPISAWNQVIFGFDPVAVDAYGAHLFGLDPLSIGYLKIAGEMKLGQLQWDKLKVARV